jgi:hypothetical protein
MTPNASTQGNPYISPIKTGAKLDPNASAFQRKQAILQQQDNNTTPKPSAWEGNHNLSTPLNRTPDVKPKAVSVSHNNKNLQELL